MSAPEINRLKKAARKAANAYHSHIQMLDYPCGLALTCEINPETAVLLKRKDEAYKALSKSDPVFMAMLNRSKNK